MQNTAAFASALDDTVAAAADRFAVVDIDFARTAAAAEIVGIDAAAGSSVVAHSTAALDTADIAAGFVGACLHPCKCGLPL